MIDEKDMTFTLDASGSVLRPEMLDRVLAALRTEAGKPLGSGRYASHSIQTVMYERAGFAFSEVNERRVAANGVEWKVDDKLPLDCVLIETEAGTGLLKNLYPLCLRCREWRAGK